MSGTLTMDVFLEAYDRLYAFPEEPAWFLCHPDDLAVVRSAFSEIRWGTCPLIRSSESCPAGKVTRVPNVFPATEGGFSPREGGHDRE